MITAYVSAAESDVHLAAYADWLALDVAVKDNHLSWGRVWIDSNYTCPEYAAHDDDGSAYEFAPEEVKHANSLAGYANFSGTLYADTQTLKSTTVTAGTVTSSKSYAGSYTKSDPMLIQADALMDYNCTLTSGKGSVSLTRD